MKGINYYYIIAGLLAILFSVTHEINGHNNAIPAQFSGALDIHTVTTFKYIWHIITAENLIFGITFIAMAFYKERKGMRFIAWLICVILVARLLVITVTTIAISGCQINDIMIDIIAIVAYVAIILLGTRMKK